MDTIIATLTHDEQNIAPRTKTKAVSNDDGVILDSLLSGKADLVDGKIPASQLPAYVDDVVEGYYDADTNSFYEDSTHTTIITPETGKIYVDLVSNLTYRYTGSTYATISSSLALGETATTAYRGDRGKAAYDHSQVVSGNPHNVTYTEIGAVPQSQGTDNAGKSLIVGTDGEVTLDMHLTYDTSEVTQRSIINADTLDGHDSAYFAVAADSLPRNFGSDNAGKALTVSSTGDVYLSDNRIVDPTLTISDAAADAKVVGDKYTAMEKKIDEIQSLEAINYKGSVETEDDLPDPSDTENVANGDMYLVKQEQPHHMVCVQNTTDGVYEWEDYGTADHGYYENIENKVTSISSSSTDDQYPSAKAVYTATNTLDTNKVSKSGDTVTGTLKFSSVNAITKNGDSSALGIIGGTSQDQGGGMWLWGATSSNPGLIQLRSSNGTNTSELRVYPDGTTAAPTPATTDNSTKIATTAYVKAQVVNNLTTTTYEQPLSAYQGYVLNNKFGDLYCCERINESGNNTITTTKSIYFGSTATFLIIGCNPFSSESRNIVCTIFNRTTRGASINKIDLGASTTLTSNDDGTIDITLGYPYHYYSIYQVNANY